MGLNFELRTTFIQIHSRKLYLETGCYLHRLRLRSWSLSLSQRYILATVCPPRWSGLYCPAVVPACPARLSARRREQPEREDRCKCDRWLLLGRGPWDTNNIVNISAERCDGPADVVCQAPLRKQFYCGDGVYCYQPSVSYVISL